MASDSEKTLEEMLKQAARLEARLAASREGSVYTMDDEDSVSHSSKKAPAVDDMLRQAELLSQKMRASRQHAFASVLSTGDDSETTSVDDMLRKAEMLSQQMKSPDASPSPGRRKRTIESTPALIRQSERLLSKAPQRTANNGSGAEMNTPELMRQTDQLLGKLKASRASVDDSHAENGSHTSGVLSNPDALIAKMQADQRGHLLAKQNKSSDQDSTKSEDLRRLMEQALSSWAGSPEQKGRVKDALEQIVPNLGSTPHTPSTVSIQPPDHDEISSVGSLSPRTRKSASRATSLLVGPSPTSDLDAAEELVRNMAIALKEARSSGVKNEDVIAPDSPPRRPEEEEDSGSYVGQPRPPPRIPSNANKSSPSRSVPAASQRTRQSQSKRNVPPPPPPPPDTPPAVPSSSVSFTPNRGHMSSEEAQYNAIMSAINTSSPPGRPVNWERVESAGADDEDYVPLVDYSKKSVTRSLGVGTFDIPLMGRSPRVRRRRRRIGRVLVVLLALAAIGVAATYWFTGDLLWNNEPTVKAEEVVYFEEPVVEPPEEPVQEQYSEYYSYRAPPAEDHSKAIVLHRTSGSKLRAKVASVARRSGKAFLVMVISLTPPWERFCSADPQSCRDTDYLLNSIAST